MWISDKEKIKQIIAKGDTEEAISKLLILTKNEPKWRNKAILLSSRFQNLKAKEVLGTLSRDETVLEVNTIKKDLLLFLEEINESNYSESKPLYFFVKYKKLLAIGLFVGSIGLIYLSQYRKSPRLSQHITHTASPSTQSLQNRYSKKTYRNDSAISDEKLSVWENIEYVNATSDAIVLNKNDTILVVSVQASCRGEEDNWKTLCKKEALEKIAGYAMIEFPENLVAKAKFLNGEFQSINYSELNKSIKASYIFKLKNKRNDN
ncbi:MAG: hypothetical protein AAF587_14310 [Bacteroidota bacterium]